MKLPQSHLSPPVAAARKRGKPMRLYRRWIAEALIYLALLLALAIAGILLKSWPFAP